MGLYRDAPDRVSNGPWFIPVTFDPYEAGILAAFLVLLGVQLVMLPFMRCTRSNIISQLAITWSIFTGYVIVSSAFVYSWQEDHVTTSAAYAAGFSHHIHAKIGLHVGLHGFNVTMKGDPLHQLGADQDWNEHVSWSSQTNNIMPWHQGRFGFGPFSSPTAQRFREMQRIGVPKPIVDVVEWFTLDGERLRWGRWYRVAGYYTTIFLWLGFALWILTNIIFVIRPKLGAAWLAALGVDLWFCCVLYSGLISMANTRLTIPVGEGVIQPYYSWGYHLLLATGIICNILGVVAYFLLDRAGYTVAPNEPRRSLAFVGSKDPGAKEPRLLTRLQTTKMRSSTLGSSLSPTEPTVRMNTDSFYELEEETPDDTLSASTASTGSAMPGAVAGRRPSRTESTVSYATTTSIL